MRSAANASSAASSTCAWSAAQNASAASRARSAVSARSSASSYHHHATMVGVMVGVRAPGSSRKFRRTDFWRREKSRGSRGWIFRRKINPAPTRRPAGELGRNFFRSPATPGRGWNFYFAGRVGAGFFFAGRPAWGRGWVFFRNGAGFFVLRLGSDPGTLMKPLRSSLLHVRMVQHPLLHPIVTHGRWVWEWGGLLQHQLDAGGAVSRAGYQVPW